MATELEILYRDEQLVAVYKPAGLLVHRSELAADREVVMILLRKQLKRKVWPLHRLDRPTAGVLLFALDEGTAAHMSQLFRDRQMDKRYLAVARGFCPPSGVIDHPLAESRDGEKRPARTSFRTLAQVELPIPVGRYQTARYSLVEAHPESGRYHQIRKHFAHISHHLVGDTAYGDGRQNRLFREHFDLHRLLLMARSLRFPHPDGAQEETITAEPDAKLKQLFERFGWWPLIQLLSPSLG